MIDNSLYDTSIYILMISCHNIIMLLELTYFLQLTKTHRKAYDAVVTQALCVPVFFFSIGFPFTFKRDLQSLRNQYKTQNVVNEVYPFYKYVIFARNWCLILDTLSVTNQHRAYGLWMKHDIAAIQNICELNSIKHWHFKMKHQVAFYLV